MQTKHTSGTWSIIAERYRYIRVVSTAGGIAHLDCTDAEGMANARLIAAAPELLAAAIKVNAMSIQTDAHKELREAIHKATRQTHNARLSGPQQREEDHE